MYSGTARCTFYFNETGNTAHPGYLANNPSKMLTGVCDVTIEYSRYTETTYNNYRWRVTAYSVTDLVTGAAYTRPTYFQAWGYSGTVNQGPSGSQGYVSSTPMGSAVNCNVPFGQAVRVGCTDRHYQSDDNALDDVELINLTEGGMVNLSPYNSGKIKVTATIENNLMMPVAVLVGLQSHTVNALAKDTWETVLEGPINNTYEITAPGEAIVWTVAYDPIIMWAEASPLYEYVREGHIGTPLETHRLHLEVTNYSEARAAAVVCKVVGWGTPIGTVNLAAYSGTGLPPWKTFDVDLKLPPGSRLQFTAGAGLTCMVTQEQVVPATQWDPATLRYYVSTAEEAQEDPVEVTANVDPNTGTQWLGVTDNSGTTSIGTSTVTTPTNTDTSTTGAIDSVTGGTTGTGGTKTAGTTYGNTSSGITSAATQQMAADLGAIRDDADRLRQNSDAERKDREDNLPANRKAAVNQVMADYSNPSAKASEAVAEATGRGESMKTAATAALASSVGTASTAALNAPAVPTDETLTLDIGPGKQITVHLNPFSPDGPLGGVILMAATFIKRLIAWSIVALFFYSTLKEVRHVCGGAFPTNSYHSQVADMVKSISIFGWSVGVPIGIVLRIAIVALIVTLVLTMPPAIFAALEAGLPWTALKEVYQSGPPGVGSGDGAGSMLLKAIGYADYVLPWRLMLSMPLYYILVQYVLFPLQMFWQMVFKFLP